MFLATELPLLSSGDEEIGRITLSITSTARSMSELVTAATSDVHGLADPHVVGSVQGGVTSYKKVTSAPIIALIDSSDAWKLLRDRLDTLMKWGDAIAQVDHVSPFVRIHYPYLLHPFRSILTSVWRGA